MELKVQVDGVERVVCGITQQTTVQEVVIALAQATGRTGRYTLVERYRDNERLLPPAETPLTVLERWGVHQDDVSFILRRSGTSDSTKDKFDKNQQIRQSLPATTKLRQNGLRNERNEKNRKSLGPGMRMRGESASSLPVQSSTLSNRQFQQSVPNMRSRSPQRRISPTRHIRGSSESRGGAPKPRQPSPTRNNIETRKSFLNKVVLDQQQTLKELEEILSRLNTNIAKFETLGKNNLNDERKLEDLVRQNENRLADESERFARTEATRRNLESEIVKCKQDLAKVDSAVAKNIQVEKQYQKQFEEKRQRIEQQQLAKKQSASNTQEELRRLSSEMRKVEADIVSKNEQIEKLNRDMRKVNLQSFVRETNSSKSGSKVTVLPPEEPKITEPKSNETSSGVWV